MAESHMVRCTTKRDGQRVSHIGGTNSNGTAWKYTEEDAIKGIKTERWKFYVTVDRQGDSHGVWLQVASHQGREYLKTDADGEEPNTLLSLPDCP